MHAFRYGTQYPNLMPYGEGHFSIGVKLVRVSSVGPLYRPELAFGAEATRCLNQSH